MRIGSSLGQLLFGTATFLVEELLRIKISIEELLSRSRNFCTVSAFSEKLHLRKSQFFRKEIFHIFYFFWRANLLQRSIFQKTLPSLTTFFSYQFFKRRYLFIRVALSQHTFSEELLFHSYASFLQLHLLFIS